MQAANLSDHVSNSINFGDYLQFSRIQSLYAKLNIDDVYYISGRDLADYSGDKLLLPINFISSIFVKDNMIALSPDIEPLFLALSFSSVIDYFDAKKFFGHDKHLEYFLKHAPIGCRDEYTYNLLRQYN